MRIFTHKRTQRDYKVLNGAKRKEDGKPLVVYQSLETGTIWVREADDFYTKFEFNKHESDFRKPSNLDNLITESVSLLEKLTPILEAIKAIVDGKQQEIVEEEKEDDIK